MIRGIVGKRLTYEMIGIGSMPKTKRGMILEEQCEKLGEAAREVIDAGELNTTEADEARSPNRQQPPRSI